MEYWQPQHPPGGDGDAFEASPHTPVSLVGHDSIFSNCVDHLAVLYNISSHLCGLI